MKSQLFAALALLSLACAPELNELNEHALAPETCTFPGLRYATWEAGKLRIAAPYTLRELIVDGEYAPLSGTSGAVDVACARPAYIVLNGQPFECVP